MASSKLQQGYIVDGQFFATAAEARDFQRKPQVKAALSKLVGGDANFVQFLLDNQDEIENAFDTGVIARVTKSEKAKLQKALEEVKSITNGKLKFIQDNADAILESFRWPAVKRLKPEERDAAVLESLTKLADEKAAKWLLANKENLMNAYQAGVEKRQAPANSGLAEYLAAKKAGPEALKAYTEAKEAAKAAAKAAAEAKA